jgi:hypothetical protein
MNRAQARVDERRQRVAGLYVRGKTQKEIAAILGVAQQRISEDLQHAREAWREDMVLSVEKHKAQHLAEIRAVIAEAWLGWERSCLPAEVSLTKAVEGQQPRREASLRREGQAGDPSFLAQVQKGLDQKAALLGLLPATRFQIDLEAMSDDELRRLAAGHTPAQVLQQMAEA